MIYVLLIGETKEIFCDITNIVGMYVCAQV